MKPVTMPLETPLSGPNQARAMLIASRDGETASRSSQAATGAIVVGVPERIVLMGSGECGCIFRRGRIRYLAGGVMSDLIELRFVLGTVDGALDEEPAIRIEWQCAALKLTSEQLAKATQLAARALILLSEEDRATNS